MIIDGKVYFKDAFEITSINIAAYNKEINIYLGRNGGSPEYDLVESEISKKEGEI